MTVSNTYILILLSGFCFQLLGQTENQSKTIWNISEKDGIVLRVDADIKLPHKDNIELSGKNVSSIIYYEIDEDKNLVIEKDIIFPQLRTYNKSNEPDWKKYRAYFRRTVGKDLTPKISFNEQIIIPSFLDSIEINGMITFYYSSIKGMNFTKQIYPSMDERFLVEEWKIENVGNQKIEFKISNFDYQHSEQGYKGNYTFIAQSKGKEMINLDPGEHYSFPVVYGAEIEGESQNQFKFNYIEAKNSRIKFLDICRAHQILYSPNDTLNKLFLFSKIRAAESIFNSSMGLVHSPGGGNYYVGIWANDQIEYSGPYFPYLGYQSGNEAAYNAYKKFLENIPKDEEHIPYAFEVDGNFPMTHQDRGDAAMIAYGTSLFLLNSGDKKQAKELWPLIEWSLEYCNNNRNVFGAVESDSDEMEGRIETGDANLSTSTLYYGGLKFASRIAHALNKASLADIYENRMAEMKNVIEEYFGATIEGLETYKYFDENKNLRHWICLPLTMDIAERKEGTLKALFEKLWTDNGVLVQYDKFDTSKEHTFWDRATLYALRGALKVGETNTAIKKLNQYSANRLLGEHVPYAVEAYPENNMKHLSAESALYCRIYIEGLLGIEPTNFREFTMVPKLPSDWNFLELNNLYLMGKSFDISIKREKELLRIIVTSESKILVDEIISQNESVEIKVNR